MNAPSSHLRTRTGGARPRRSGFTLLELVLAMMISAMLALSLYSALNAAMRAQKSAEAAVSPARSTSAAADMIGNDLQSVVQPGNLLAGAFIGTKPGGVSGGDADSLSFYCVGVDGDDSPLAEGIRNVELAVRTDVTPATLVRRVNRNLLATVQEEPQEEILCRGVKSFTVRYFDGTAWTDTYDSTATTTGTDLPVAVELNLEIYVDPDASSASDGAVNPANGEKKTYVIRRVIPIAQGVVAATG